jgi:phosphate transport system protein
MGGMAEVAIARAIQAIGERDSELARSVIDDDDAIDRLELEIDDLCIDVLVLQQPAASDLRFVVGVAKTAPNIERIADHAVNIAKHAAVLNNLPELRLFVDLPQMSRVVQEMLVGGLDAFTSVDQQRAWEVIHRDDNVDDLYRSITRQLIDHLAADSNCVEQVVQLLFVVKHLERIADYVTNICELVVYMKRGAVIKHLVEE